MPMEAVDSFRNFQSISHPSPFHSEVEMWGSMNLGVEVVGQFHSLLTNPSHSPPASCFILRPFEYDKQKGSAVSFGWYTFWLAHRTVLRRAERALKLPFSCPHGLRDRSRLPAVSHSPTARLIGRRTQPLAPDVFHSMYHFLFVRRIRCKPPGLHHHCTRVIVPGEDILRRNDDIGPFECSSGWS